MNSIPHSRLADRIPVELPDYVWDERIPTRGITLVVGASGVGKSTLGAMLASRWTTGALTGRPEHVLLVMTEDDESFVTVPRLMAHGADLSRIHLPEDPKHRWYFPRDLDLLRVVVSTTGARVVVLDPLQGLVGNLSSQAGRQALDGLHGLAQDLGVAIVFLHHFIKATLKAKTVRDAIGGGYGVYGIARSILVLGWEPGGSPEDGDEPAGERLVLAHEKSSHGVLTPSILYVRQSRPHPAEPVDPSKTIGALTEIKQVAHTALEVMYAAPDGTVAEVNVSAREQAKALVLMLLAQAEEHGLRADELKGRVTGAGISATTFERARADLKAEGMIESFQTKNGQGQTTGWRWRLVSVPDFMPE